jgi:hypothetical protein
VREAFSLVLSDCVGFIRKLRLDVPLMATWRGAAIGSFRILKES